MSVLVPQIQSIVNGLITITVLDPVTVEASFDQLLVFKAPTINGPFSQIATLSLTGASSYSVLDTTITPNDYYAARFFNSVTSVNGALSSPAQETGVFSEYSVPESTATYPPEIALSQEDREIVEAIRIVLGDLGSIERDFYNSADPANVAVCAGQLSQDLCTWELSNPKGWPRRVRLDGVDKVSLNDPQVIGYRYLAFSGTACITGTLDVFYNHFRFSDREILLAFDQAVNSITLSCKLTPENISKELRILQASVNLLEGEIRQLSVIDGAPLRVQDGDTEYDNTARLRLIDSRRQELEDLQRRLRETIRCAMYEVSYSLEGVRLD